MATQMLHMLVHDHVPCEQDVNQITQVRSQSCKLQNLACTSHASNNAFDGKHRCSSITRKIRATCSVRQNDRTKPHFKGGYLGGECSLQCTICGIGFVYHEHFVHRSNTYTNAHAHTNVRINWGTRELRMHSINAYFSFDSAKPALNCDGASWHDHFSSGSRLQSLLNSSWRDHRSSWCQETPQQLT